MTYMSIIEDILGFINSLIEKVKEFLGSVTVKHGYEMDEYQPGYVEPTTL